MTPQSYQPDTGSDDLTHDDHLVATTANGSHFTDPDPELPDQDPAAVPLSFVLPDGSVNPDSLPADVEL